MNKKYMLKIPESARMQAKLVSRLSDVDVITNPDIGFADIPKDWLTPIEEGPVSAEELFKRALKESSQSKANFSNYDHTKGWFCMGVEAERKNDRKRTQPVIDTLVSIKELYEDNTLVQLKLHDYQRICDALKTLEEK